MSRSCWCGAGEPGREYVCRCQELFYAPAVPPDYRGYWRDRALRAEALVREKDEAIGELLQLIDLAGFWDKVDDLAWS